MLRGEQNKDVESEDKVSRDPSEHKTEGTKDASDAGHQVSRLTTTQQHTTNILVGRQVCMPVEEHTMAWCEPPCNTPPQLEGSSNHDGLKVARNENELKSRNAATSYGTWRKRRLTGRNRNIYKNGIMNRPLRGLWHLI